MRREDVSMLACCGSTVSWRPEMWQSSERQRPQQPVLKDRPHPLLDRGHSKLLEKGIGVAYQHPPSQSPIGIDTSTIKYSSRVATYRT